MSPYSHCRILLEPKTILSEIGLSILPPIKEEGIGGGKIKMIKRRRWERQKEDKNIIKVEKILDPPNSPLSSSSSCRQLLSFDAPLEPSCCFNTFSDIPYVGFCSLFLPCSSLMFSIVFIYDPPFYILLRHTFWVPLYLLETALIWKSLNVPYKKDREYYPVYKTHYAMILLWCIWSFQMH